MNIATTVLVGALTGLIGTATLNAQDDADAAIEMDGMEHVVFETTLGSIVLELDSEKAPITVENFLQYVEDGFFDDTIFHRVMKGFVIQGGGFSKGMVKKETRPGIENEWENGLKNLRGTISMARLSGQANSGTSQFFINHKDNAVLDNPRDGSGYAVFGSVVAGMPVVDAIASQSVGDKVTPQGRMQNVPMNDLFIVKAFRISDEDAAEIVKSVDAKNAAVIGDWQSNENLRQLQMAEDLVEGKVGNLNGASTTESGLWILDEVEGSDSADAVKAGETVIAHYDLWLPNGTMVQSSRTLGEPSRFSLKQVIAAWKEGIQGMTPGTIRWLIAPADLAYGAQGRPGIPSNTALVFKVELVERIPN